MIEGDELAFAWQARLAWMACERQRDEAQYLDGLAVDLAETGLGHARNSGGSFANQVRTV